MRWHSLALSAILGLSVPAIAEVAVPRAAIAQVSPNGEFQDGEWSVTVRFDGTSHTYYGRNLRSGDDIYLSGASVRGSSARRVYTWNNAGTRYQVAWQPGDPNVIRLQVFSGGRQLLNRLLYRVSY